MLKFDIVQASFEFNESQPSDDEVYCSSGELEPQLFVRDDLNNLVRDLRLTNENSKPIIKNLFAQCFRQKKNLIYCHDIGSLMKNEGRL